MYLKLRLNKFRGIFEEIRRIINWSMNAVQNPSEILRTPRFA